MKNFLLLFTFIYSISAAGQNPPIAVADTIYIQNIFIANQDTFSFSPSLLTENDSDPDNDWVRVKSIIYNGTNYVNSVSNNGYVRQIQYITGSNFSTQDTFKYVVQEYNALGLQDTGVVILKTLQKSHEVLDANNIAATVNKNALFSSPYEGRAGFEAPKGSNTHSIYAANLWVAGSLNGNIVGNVRKFASQPSIGSGSFISNSGPVSNSSHIDSLVNRKWDRVWKVYQHEIDFHLSNWNNTGYNPPQSLLDWPAHGDTANGEAYYLAPFIDANNNGKYSPYEGDYPKIKGDQSVYFIYNDGLSKMDINPMITEVHGMAYAFQCSDSALQNTIFVDYKVFNRSLNTYTYTYFGMWADMDLGNGQDDFMQCDVDRNLFFTLNGDAFDNGNYGLPGYGDHIPAQACMLLKGAKQDGDGQDNDFGINQNESTNGTGFGDGISDNEYWGMTGFQYSLNGGVSALSDPTSGYDYFNFLNGYWKDVSHVVYGGSGHQNHPGATATEANFAFPGSSDTYNYGTNGVTMPPWTEVTAGNTPGDRRGVSSTGPVTFAPGDEIELTYAFVFGRDYVNTGAQAGVTNMLERADSIRSYYDQGMLTACGFPVSVKESVVIESEISVYPNPAKNIVNIRQYQAEYIQIEVVDVTGKVVLATSSSNQLTQADISGLTNGVYLVKVQSDKVQSTVKIIKQ